MGANSQQRTHYDKINELDKRQPDQDYHWDTKVCLYSGEDATVWEIRRKSDNKPVAMKQSKFYIGKNSDKRRTEPEWLNEINTYLKAKQFSEILSLYDHFRFDDAIYTVTDLCVYDLQYAIE